jgi:hypothetical protein
LCAMLSKNRALLTPVPLPVMPFNANCNLCSKL